MIIIAGPCVIESREGLLEIAQELEPLAKDERIDFYFQVKL